ncbi:hypothetical protein [Streptomyces sp. NPDC006333]|uniref:hypothetical protein n=1 Tax=Streptomyces sp. NPDC006333 TaxID=3156753 RepID=UPI0033A3C685
MSNETGSAKTAAHCGNCAQDVQPEEHRGWAGFLSWLALLEFGSVIAAVVHAISPFSPDTAGGVVGRLILWPAAVTPAWLSIVGAIAAFITVAALAGSASGRATEKTTCPRCHLPLKTAAG